MDELTSPQPEADETLSGREVELCGIGVSRRSVVAAALASLGVTSGVSEARAFFANPSSKDAPAEGFFIVWKEGSQSRVFFLRSTWLSYFEITDLSVNSSDLGKVVNKIENPSKAGAKKHAWSVLYADDLLSSDLLTLNNVTDFGPPPFGSTYLAMNIAPG